MANSRAFARRECSVIIDGNGLFRRRAVIVGNAESGKSDKQCLPGRYGAGTHLARIKGQDRHDSRGERSRCMPA